MKDPNIIRAYDRAAPDAAAEARVLRRVYAALQEAEPAPKRSRPLLRKALAAAACIAILAALLTVGYAAYEKWKLPKPESYEPNERGGNVSVHTEHTYSLPLNTEHAGSASTDGSAATEPAPLSDEYFLLRAREILLQAGIADADAANATVRRQTHLYWNREEVEVSWPHNGSPISVTFDAENGVFIGMVGIDWVLSDAAACQTQEEADALARRYYESLPVEQGYVMTGCEKYDEQFWSYDFCRELEPGLYSWYECVRVAVNPVSGGLEFCKVFYVPLLDDHDPGDEPLSEEAARAAALANGHVDLSKYRFVSAEKCVCLPNWFFTDDMDVHLKASAVTRLCWSLRYEYDGELYTGSTVLWVDYYTGEILGGDTTG